MSNIFFLVSKFYGFNTKNSHGKTLSNVFLMLLLVQEKNLLWKYQSPLILHLFALRQGQILNFVALIPMAIINGWKSLIIVTKTFIWDESGFLAALWWDQLSLYSLSPEE